MQAFQREVVMTILAASGRTKPSKALSYIGNVADMVKLDGQKPYTCKRNVKVLLL